MTRQDPPRPNSLMSLQMQRRLPGLLCVLAAFVLIATCTTSLGLSRSPVARADAVARKTSCANTYTVVSGDFWVAIAQRYGVTLTALLQVNNATASTAIYPGTVLCLPDNAVAPSTTTPTTTIATTTVTVPGATTTTVAGGATVVPLAAFPIQGPCWFTDTWHAPRSGDAVRCPAFPGGPHLRPRRLLAGGGCAGRQ